MLNEGARYVQLNEYCMYCEFCILLFTDSSLQMIYIMSWKRCKNTTFKINLRFFQTTTRLLGTQSPGGVANLSWAGWVICKKRSLYTHNLMILLQRRNNRNGYRPVNMHCNTRYLCMFYVV